MVRLSTHRNMQRQGFGNKIALSFLLVILISCGAGVFALLEMWSASRATAEISREQLPEMRLASAFEREILNARISFIYHVTIQKPGALDMGWRRFNNARDLMPQLRAHVYASAKLAALRAPTDQLARDLETYEVTLRQILSAVENHQNQGDAFKQTLAKWASLGGTLVKSAAALNSDCDLTVERTAQQQTDTLRRDVWLTACCALLGAIVGPLIAAGAIRALRAKLISAVHELTQASTEIGRASAEVARSSQALSQGATEQAASIEQTSASCEQINSMARRSAEHANSMATTMAASDKASSSGLLDLEHMVQAMNDIQSSSEKVSKIIKVIDEIAFQTNILALNAAVEAARAGEAGLGFAVVADEVRNLAQRAAQTAKDTADLIAQSVATANAGQSQVERVAVSIRTIAEQSTRAKTLADEVRVGSQEQTQGLDQIARTIAELESVTQRAAKSAEESAAAAELASSQTSRIADISLDLTSIVGSVPA